MDTYTVDPQTEMEGAILRFILLTFLILLTVGALIFGWYLAFLAHTIIGVAYTAVVGWYVWGRWILPERTSA